MLKKLIVFTILLLFVLSMFAFSTIVFAEDEKETTVSGTESLETEEPTYQYSGDINGKELPEIEEKDVKLAEKIEVKNETSDISLLPGVILWLLVAIGIAVIAGYIVYKVSINRW